MRPANCRHCRRVVHAKKRQSLGRGPSPKKGNGGYPYPQGDVHAYTDMRRAHDAYASTHSPPQSPGPVPPRPKVSVVSAPPSPQGPSRTCGKGQCAVHTNPHTAHFSHPGTAQGHEPTVLREHHTAGALPLAPGSPHTEGHVLARPAFRRTLPT